MLELSDSVGIGTFSPDCGTPPEDGGAASEGPGSAKGNDGGGAATGEEASSKASLRRVARCAGSGGAATASAKGGAPESGSPGWTGGFNSLRFLRNGIWEAPGHCVRSRRRAFVPRKMFLARNL